MSTTIEVTIRAEGAGLETALAAIRSLDPWALELFDDTSPIRILALLPDRPEPARARVAAALDAARVPPIAIEARAPAIAEEWGSGWRDRLRATQVGPLWILPTGRSPPPGADRVLVIDALQAFGAGTHETTLLCLERVVERSPLGIVLDVGTGSGILAIAALALGAGRAVGTDIDPNALAIAKQNADRNRVGPRFETFASPPEVEADLVIANVRTPALIDLAPELLRRVAPGGSLSLSGIRVEERAAILAAYEACGARATGQARRGDWLRVDYDSNPPPGFRV